MDKIYGKRRAIVINPKHPEKPGFVQVHIPGISYSLDEDKYPWAEMLMTTGAGFNEGTYIPFKKDDLVWVEFLNDGDRNSPIVVGWCVSSPDELFSGPHDAFGGPRSLDDQHDYPKIINSSNERLVDPDYEETVNSVEGRSVAFTKEGFNFRIQNGALTITHLKTKARLEISENGFIDVSAKENLFLRARRRLRILSAEMAINLLRSLKLEFPILEQKIKSWKLETDNLSITSTGLAEILAKAVKVVSDSDFLISSQGKGSVNANGSLSFAIQQNMIKAPDKAFSAEVNVAGSPLAGINLTAMGDYSMQNSAGAVIGAELTGLLVAENSVGSLKDKLEGILTKLSELVDESKDLIIDTGTGPGKINTKSVSNLMKLKSGIATLKAELSLVFK